MPAWTTKGVHVVLAMDRALEMFLRADQWSRNRGGRYEGRYEGGHAALSMWLALLTPPGRPSAPCAVADFHWRIPFDGEVTLYRLGWDPEEGGSEELNWEALEVLAGRSLRPDAL